jgi:hypothetical protein
MKEKLPLLSKIFSFFIVFFKLTYLSIEYIIIMDDNLPNTKKTPKPNLSHLTPDELHVIKEVLKKQERFEQEIFTSLK